MPIYEFVCERCGRLVERLQKVTDPPPDACPECGGKMAKIMSRNSFQLKGGGWYRDLYGSSGSSKPPETKTETKTEVKKDAPAPASAPSTPGKKDST